MTTTQSPTPAASGLDVEFLTFPAILWAMRNWADVADRCAVTEGHAPSCIRVWADQIEALAAQHAPGVGGDDEHEADIAKATEWVNNSSALPLSIRFTLQQLLSTRPAESVAQGGEVEYLPPWPPLPAPWSGSAVTVTWKEDGTTSTRNVYTDEQMRSYGLACAEMAESAMKATPTPATGSGGEAVAWVKSWQMHHKPWTWILNDAESAAGMPDMVPLYTHPAPAGGDAGDSERLDYIERTFAGCSNQERYLPLRMIWGKGCNGRTLREACDKYMARDGFQSRAREK